MHVYRHHRWHELVRRKALAAPVVFNALASAPLNKRATITSSSATATCTQGDTSARCELPAGATNSTLPILLGAMVPIFIACLVLVYLHRRHTLKLAKEDAMDKTKSMDFGMEFGSGRSKIPPAHLADGEKSDSRSRRQVSLDIDVASPYLLPTGLHNSRETLHTLGASGDDRYGRPMTAGRDSSIYAHSLRHDDSPDGSQMSMNGGLLSEASPMPMSTPPPPRKGSLLSSPPRSVPQISIPSPAVIKPPASGLPSNPRAALPTCQIEESTVEQTGMHQPIPQQSAKGPPSALQVVPLAHRPQVDIQFDLVEPSRPLSDDQSEYGEGPQFRLSMASEPSEMEGITRSQVAGRNSLAPAAFEDRRLSIGFRPLPPEGTADENAEERAMRIRSFYKEYFEDTSAAPPMPTPRFDRQDNYYGEYHDDSVAVYDQEIGRFVIPGAKPFAEAPARRAMTPPPRMPPRFGGPSLRNGSAASGRFVPSGPRSFSSASGRVGPVGPSPPRKPMVPPAPLQLLPTPSMLKEDAFASPNMFAPASRIPGDGTESPNFRGGLRPYSPSVSPHVPLASAFDELAVLPNPHNLRNSSTFTGLDFAPPRKFKNDDVTSDSGSIRSNNSGVSALQVQNIRNGAYRVSRIPQDVVPAKDTITSNLKPTWDMRK